MIFKFKMTSTKNIFSILESYWSYLSPHIVFILKTSGYVSFRALSKITAEKILDIQTDNKLAKFQTFVPEG